MNTVKTNEPSGSRILLTPPQNHLPIHSDQHSFHKPMPKIAILASSIPPRALAAVIHLIRVTFHQPAPTLIPLHRPKHAHTMTRIPTITIVGNTNLYQSMVHSSAHPHLPYQPSNQAT
ncbi:hypothetical protein P280DRAFT_474946 [Massarina eburnea CBS 473.64]|uniref:Uncharacterized protein n=1 Tax=Massarina eburnea CBS 473.64 TaxID=1395130 RepID=A0A6A6RHZ1_9PLEO|nr:hypothetical protein P280DRAFT_474946 [Massarina eburnea CBS 473.64]